MSIPLLYDEYCKCKLFIKLRSIGTPDVATCTVAVDSFVSCNMYDRNCLKPWVFVLWIQWRSFIFSYKRTMKKIDEYWSCCLCSRPLFKARCPFECSFSLSSVHCGWRLDNILGLKTETSNGLSIFYLIIENKQLDNYM